MLSGSVADKLKWAAAIFALGVFFMLASVQLHLLPSLTMIGFLFVFPFTQLVIAYLAFFGGRAIVEPGVRVGIFWMAVFTLIVGFPVAFLWTIMGFAMSEVPILGYVLTGIALTVVAIPAAVFAYMSSKETTALRRNMLVVAYLITPPLYGLLVMIPCRSGAVSLVGFFGLYAALAAFTFEAKFPRSAFVFYVAVVASVWGIVAIRLFIADEALFEAVTWPFRAQVWDPAAWTTSPHLLRTRFNP